MKQPLVTLLSPTLSSNAFLRTFALARLLERDFGIQIIGFDAGATVNASVRDSVPWPCERVYSASVFGLVARSLPQAIRLIRGDVIYCVKPLLGSFGIGLRARRALQKPLLLDIDDWEMGFVPSSPSWELSHYGFRWLTSTESPLYRRMLDWLTPKADALTVSNALLQALYGGVWIPHARDESHFHPSAPQPPQDEASSPRKVVLFLGTARSHKGMGVLARAWPLVRRDEAILRLVVPNPEALPAELVHDGGTVEVRDAVPFDRVPEVVEQADIFVIPQRRLRASVGQLPAKLMDAMAMGKPIVSTSVGDIPRWLDGGAGMVVPPDDPSALADAIRYLLDHPAAAAEMGRRARERFLQFGSMAAVRPRLVALIHGVLERRSMPSALPAFSSAETLPEIAPAVTS